MVKARSGLDPIMSHMRLPNTCRYGTLGARFDGSSNRSEYDFPIGVTIGLELIMPKRSKTKVEYSDSLMNNFRLGLSPYFDALHDLHFS